MSPRDSRDAFITGGALGGLTLVLITEALSALHAVTRPAIALVWLGSVAAAVVFARRRSPAEKSRDTVSANIKSEWAGAGFPGKAAAVGCAGVLAITLFLAIYCPPSAPDALSYHLPRVERWILDRSLAFYPTHDERQLWIGPGHEYFLLHLRVLTGSDRVSNLVQWAAFALSPIAVSVVARELGAMRRGQILAAMLAITIPMAISQASGSQVDLVASFWLTVAISLLLRVRRTGGASTSIVTAVALGAAAGMSFLSKGTSAIFLAPFVAWILIGLVPGPKVRLAALSGIALTASLVVAGPQMIRTARVFGNPLVSAKSMVMNDVFTPGALVSNVMRNVALHLNAPFEPWNRLLFNTISTAHSALGIDIQDRRTTWPHREFSVVAKRYDEHVSGNPLHALLFVLAAFIAVRRRLRVAVFFAACLVTGALIFAFLLKWQPWHSRMHLPLFVAACGFTGAMLERKFSPRVTALIACILVAGAVPPLCRDMLRPVIARQSVFSKTYEENMFADLPSAYPEYAAASDLLAARGCTRIGLLNSEGAFEFPLWKMLRDRAGSVEIRHVQVSNRSLLAAGGRDRRYEPCAVVQLVRLNQEAFNRPPEGFVEELSSKHATVFFKTAAGNPTQRQLR